MQDTLSEGTARAAQLAPSAVTASAVGGSATRSVAGRVSPTTSGSSAVSPAGGSRPSPPRHQGFRVYRCLHYGKLSPAATKPTQNHSMLHITKQKLIHDVVNYPTGARALRTQHTPRQPGRAVSHHAASGANPPCACLRRCMRFSITARTRRTQAWP